MDTELIEKQLEKVDPIIKNVFFSVEVAEEIAKIGEENGLLLDQVDSLIEETGYMVIGLKRADDYVNIITKKLGIEDVVARKIATSINDTVLKEVREEIQKLNEQEAISDAPSLIAPIEQAGRFTVDKPPVGMGGTSQYKETNINKEAVLSKIEDPETPVGKPIPMVDHLLTTPVSNPVQVETKKALVETLAPTATPAITPTPKAKSYSADPYREQI